MSVLLENSFGQSEPPGQTFGTRVGKNVNKEHVVSVGDRGQGVLYFNEQHCGQVMKVLKRQRETGDMCDTILEVNKSVMLKAHRCVLAANSAYFGTRLSHLSNEISTMSIETKDVRAFEAVLDYMYSGHLSITMETAEELLFLCQKLAVTDINLCCSQHLEKNLDISNWFLTLRLAVAHNLVHLHSGVQKFVIDNFSLIYQEKELLELSPAMFQNIISNCNSQNDCDIESYAMEAVIRWTAHDRSRRENCLPELLKMMRPHMISKDCLDKIIAKTDETEREVLQNKSLADLIYEVYAKHEQDQRRLDEEEKRRADQKAAAPRVCEESAADAGELSNVTVKKEREEDIEYSHADTHDLKCETAKQITPKTEAGAHCSDISDDNQAVSDVDTDVYDPVDDVDSIISQQTSSKRLTDDGSSEVEDKTTSATLEVSSSGEPIVVLEGLTSFNSPSTVSQRSKRKASKPIKISSVDLEEGNYVPVKRPRGRPPKNRTDPPPITKRRLKIRGQPLKKKKTKSFGTQTQEDTKDSIWEETETTMDFMGDGEEELEEAIPKIKVKVKRREKYKLHREHTIFKCTKCPKQFTTPGALRHHFKGHGVDTPFLCETCGFSTIHLGSMNVHKRQHNGNKFKCTFPGCSYENIRKSRLDDHMSAHTGIKNHMCSVCGKAFSGRKHMQRHEKIHLEVKPIQCEKCDWRSTRRDKLRDHIRKHHSEWALNTGYATLAEIEKAKQPEAPRPRRVRKKKKEEPGGKTFAAMTEVMPSVEVAQGTVTLQGSLQGSTTTISDEMLSYLTNIEVTGDRGRPLVETTLQAPPTAEAGSLAVVANPVPSAPAPATSVPSSLGVDYWLYVQANPHQYPQ